MAAIALPRLRAPKLNLAVLKSPRVGLIGAGVVCAGAVIALLVMIWPLVAGDTHHPTPLADSLSHAPPGWSKALKPAQGGPIVHRDVVRLSERPLRGAPGHTPAAHRVGPGPAMLGDSLSAAPMEGFYAPGPGGPLPIIAADGRTPAEIYARPFRSNGRPKVAMVVGGLGLNAQVTRQAIETLRPEVTLSFAVYSDDLQGWIDMARARGHEVLIEAPLEPLDYPENDPGPYTLLSDGRTDEIAHKLEWVLSRGSGYFGVFNYLGSRFLAADPAYAAFAGALKGRGVAFIDDGLASKRAGALRATAGVIDREPGADAIEQQLLALEAGALQRGQALGAAQAYPISLEKVARWTEEVEQRGYQLAPASALLTPKK